MSDLRFPTALRPIVSQGYSLTRGNNIFRNSVQGGAPRQGRDTYYDAVPFSVVLVVSRLGRQAFYAFLNRIDGGANSFIMVLDSGLGLEDHQVWITSTISDSTQDGINWTISFTLTAERTSNQEDDCLAENLPDLYGCYADSLGCFLKAYGESQTTFPRIWDPLQ
jgi:hypothetical protein